MDEWDPIPVYDDTGEAPPHGEYDDLIWRVLRLLEDGASAADLAAHLRAALQAQYGIVGPPTTLAFAQRLRAWWDEGEGVR